jgi:manganese/iron transport system permease protein
VALIEWFTEPFTLGFQQRALVGGILAGLMCAVVGTWLVLRGMAFFGDAFTHGVVPGIAAAVALNFSPLLGAAIAAVVMLLLIETVRRHSSRSEDTAIGLLFVGMLGLGVVIISKVDSYTGSLTSILFGDALGVTRQDIAWQLALGAVVIGASILLYRPLLALSFNEQKAYLLGMRPKMAHAALLVLIATAVIGSFQAVGTLLVFALLVGPPATASLVSRTVPRMMIGAALLSVVSVWLGLVISYHLGTAASATMAIIPVAIFFLVLPFSRAINHRRQLRDNALAEHSGDGVGSVA